LAFGSGIGLENAVIVGGELYDGVSQNKISSVSGGFSSALLLPQQAVQVALLPLFSLPMIRELLFGVTKFGRVNAPASIDKLPGNAFMQHFMEDHVFDHIAWYKGLIQQAMDTNEPIYRMI
jgi:hypothetical protein